MTQSTNLDLLRSQRNEAYAKWITWTRKAFKSMTRCQRQYQLAWTVATKYDALVKQLDSQMKHLSRA